TDPCPRRPTACRRSPRPARRTLEERDWSHVAGSLVDGDGRLLAEQERAVRGGVDGYDVSIDEVALQQAEGDRIGHLTLQQPLQRPGAEVGVVARSGEVRPGLVRELEAE